MEPEMSKWLTLYDRLGSAIANPSSDQMAQILRNLFSNSQDTEHFECWIECGSEDGPLVTYTVTSKGTGRIVTHSDADMSEEVSEEILQGLTAETALRSWEKFIGGES